MPACHLCKKEYKSNSGLSNHLIKRCLNPAAKPIVKDVKVKPVVVKAVVGGKKNIEPPAVPVEITM